MSAHTSTTSTTSTTSAPIAVPSESSAFPIITNADEVQALRLQTAPSPSATPSLLELAKMLNHFLVGRDHSRAESDCAKEAERDRAQAERDRAQAERERKIAGVFFGAQVLCA